MEFKMEMANLLAKNIKEFIDLVDKHQKDDNHLIVNKDKVYQVKLFIEEWKFQVLADELQRINQFCWNEKYTCLLVEDFRKGMVVIDEYVARNYDDLFILAGRLHILGNISRMLTKPTSLLTE
ncbi:hypothetical protein [Bacillus testis]|uniref:hypothetical protein n=1 Tax=Bacillus testis TaxID=1622072 RepID=UPI00067F5E6C|nr:hypothetical protein [Bacillus testis]